MPQGRDGRRGTAPLARAESLLPGDKDVLEGLRRVERLCAGQPINKEGPTGKTRQDDTGGDMLQEDGKEGSPLRGRPGKTKVPTFPAGTIRGFFAAGYSRGTVPGKGRGASENEEERTVKPLSPMEKHGASRDGGERRKMAGEQGDRNAKSPPDILRTLLRRDKRSGIVQPVSLPATGPGDGTPLETGSGKQKVRDRYWLKKGFCFASIVESELFDLLYVVTEPTVSQRERVLLEEVHDYLRDVLIYDTVSGKDEMKVTFEDVKKAISFYVPDLPDDRISVIHYYLERNLQGYGAIDPLMHDEFIEDISCNGYTSPVFVYHTEYGSIPTSITFSAQELNRYVLKLSQKADKQVSISSPLLDAPLPDGSRAQITYIDVISSKGSSFTIRRFKSDPMTPVNLVRYGTYDPEVLAYIWLAVENRKSMIIVGGDGKRGRPRR